MDIIHGICANLLAQSQRHTRFRLEQVEEQWRFRK
jgi:hypothetical protein